MSQRELTSNNLDACWTSVGDCFSKRDSQQWDTLSLCPEWSVKGIAAHMVSVEQVLSNWMPSGIDTPPPFQDVEGYMNAALNMSATDLVAPLQSTFDVRRTNLAEPSDEDFATASITPVGPGTYGRFMAIREFDFWMHERDCRMPLGMETYNGGPTAEMALNEVHLSIGYIAGKNIGLTEGQSIHFDITGAVNRDIYVAVEGSASETETLSTPSVTLQ